MSAILGLFNIFALIYILRSLQLTTVIWREWGDLNQEPLTQHKKHLAEQASFFVAVPVGVLLHELGHALATWLFGGQVVEFGYRVFWGYVVPQGVFSPAQDWFISLAGTLGSLLFGLGLWGVLRHHRASTLRYFGLRAFRFQVYFALIYYPVFTLFLPIGDWRTIYDFQVTPALSGLTAPVHLALLALFWWGSRIGWFEMASHESMAEHERFTALAQKAAVNPQDTELQLQYINALRQGGATNKARAELGKFLKRNPDSAAAYLQLAALQSQNQSHVSRAAYKNVNEALRRGLSRPNQLAFAHQLLGQYHLDRDDSQQAVNHLSQAMANLDAPRLVEEESGRNTLYRARLFHLRSQAYRRQRQYELAYQDLQQAITLAEGSGDNESAAFYRNQLQILEKHAGRALDVPFSDLSQRERQ